MKIKIAFVILTLFTSSFSVQAQDWNEVMKSHPPNIEQSSYYGRAVDIYGNYAVVGAWQEDEDVNGENFLSNAGSAYILYNDAGNWKQVQKIVASDRAQDDYFGISVAISGDYIFVGAHNKDEEIPEKGIVNKTGCVYVFYNNNGTWQEVQKIISPVGGENDAFGFSISVSGNYAIIGAHQINALGEFGFAYIYYNSSGVWQEVQKLTASDKSVDDRFGYSVDISGSYAIIGAYWEDEDASGENTLSTSGSSYIFHNDEGNWIEMQKIVASDRGVGDCFGNSVAISQNYVIVGAYYEDNDVAGENFLNYAGSAYIFYNNSGTWEEVQKIVPSDRSGLDFFGKSVAIIADVAVVGSSKWFVDESLDVSLPYTGSAYVYYNQEGTWQEVQKIVPSDPGYKDYFGRCAISENYIIIGAPEKQIGEVNYPKNGATYIYTRQPIVNNHEQFGKFLCTSNFVTTAVTAEHVDNYQWQISKDGGGSFENIEDENTYSGIQTESLSFTAIAEMNNYQYRCMLINEFDTVTSQADTLLFEIIPPTITSIHDDITLEANENCQAILSDYTLGVIATDNCDTDLEITQTPVAGTLISDTNEITLTATDDAGNFESVSFNVAIEDNASPVITSTHDNLILNTNENCQALLPDYTRNIIATDNCDNDLEVSQTPAAGNLVSGATNEVNLTVVDETGNSTSVSFNVAIVDITVPTINCQQNQSININSSKNGYTVSGTEFDPSSTEDNCSVSSVTNDFNNLSSLDGAELPIGTTTISWTVTDEAGNTATCNYQIVVNPATGFSDLSKSCISVYPNPTNGILQIDFGQNKVEKMIISNLSGKALIEKTNLQAKEEIDLSKFKNGVYFITIEVDKEIFTSKIIKK